MNFQTLSCISNVCNLEYFTGILVTALGFVLGNLVAISNIFSLIVSLEATVSFAIVSFYIITTDSAEAFSAAAASIAA